MFFGSVISSHCVGLFQRSPLLFILGASYEGCFKYRRFPEQKNVTVKLGSTLNPQLCIQVCQVQGYARAIVRGDTEGECTCVQEIKEMISVPEEKCWSPCMSDPNLSCGNDTWVHVYKTSKCGSRVV